MPPICLTRLRWPAKLSGEAEQSPPRPLSLKQVNGTVGRTSGGFSGALVKLLEKTGKHQPGGQQLHDQVGLVRYAPPELAPEAYAAAGRRLAADLASSLNGRPARTGASRFPTKPALSRCSDREKIAEERVRAEVLADPNVGRSWTLSPTPNSNPSK